MTSAATSPYPPPGIYARTSAEAKPTVPEAVYAEVVTAHLAEQNQESEMLSWLANL